jgi:integrase
MARQANRLTPKEVTSLTEPGFYPDGNRLYMQISKWGTKSWVFRYALDGRARYMGLGSIKDVSLAEARARARRASHLVIDGKDPLEVKRQERDERRAHTADNMLFKDAVERYLALHKATWKNAKHKYQWDRLTKDARELATRRIADIDMALINAVLASMWAKTPETARRTKQRVVKVCQWVKDGMPPPHLNGNGIQHHAALPYGELPAFMAELSAKRSMSARALEFTILTACRTTEVLEARWNEIEGGVWTIPGSRMKAGKAHRVPLSRQALNLLERLPRDGSCFIFPGTLANKPMSNMTMLKLLQDMKPGYTVHGFRSSFSDWARENTNYPRDVVELALAHAIKDKTEAAYRRGDALLKRTKLTQQWADHCTSELVEATVSDLAEVRAGR